ncbi:MAG TPA: hypothetical protein PLB14_11535 [Smithellaceae bacterium]|nr:hypothetical protein [Syntrophaceae bacterium]HPV50333.1 hypothetical protein [Smithellaceae bacterium]
MPSTGSGHAFDRLRACFDKLRMNGGHWRFASRFIAVHGEPVEASTENYELSAIHYPT